MIQTFVWNIICLFTLLVIRKMTPIPIVMEAWKRKKKWKCFLSVPVIHDPSNLPHVSSSYLIHTSLLSADHTRILRHGQQASPQTLRDRLTMYLHTGQYDHTLKNDIMLLIFYTLKTLPRRFPCGCNLSIVICDFIVA